MAALVAADVQARLAGHARMERLTRAGLVNATPVIQQCTKDMRVEAERNLATENDGKNPARRPNTLLSGTPALGGPRGGIARATRIVGLESRVRPRRYDILCFSSAIGEYMQHGTRPHTITATNPSGRLAFRVAVGGDVPLRNAGRFAQSAARATGPLRATRRTVASRLLASVPVSWRTPQSVHHPGTPPRPFLVYSGAFFDAHLWQPWLRYVQVAATGQFGDVL